MDTWIKWENIHFLRRDNYISNFTFYIQVTHKIHNTYADFINCALTVITIILIQKKTFHTWNFHFTGNRLKRKLTCVFLLPRTCREHQRGDPYLLSAACTVVPSTCEVSWICDLLRRTQLHSSLTPSLGRSGLHEGRLLCKPWDPQPRNACLVERPIFHSKNQTPNRNDHKGNCLDPGGRLPTWGRGPAVPRYPRPALPGSLWQISGLLFPGRSSHSQM